MKKHSKKEKFLVSVFFFFLVFSFSEKIKADALDYTYVQPTMTMLGNGIYKADFSGTAVFNTDVCADDTGEEGHVYLYAGVYPDRSTLYFNNGGSWGVGLCNGTWKWGTEVGTELASTSISNSNTLPIPDGDYWEDIYSNNNHSYYTSFFVESGIVTAESTGVSNATVIISVTPENAELLSTSSTQTIGATGRINENDLNNYSVLEIHIENSNYSFKQCADVICAGISSTGISLDFSYPLVVDSYFNYSSTTSSLPVGKYYMITKIRTGSYCLLGLCANTRTLVSTSTTFIIATTTKADKLKDAAINYVNDLNSDSDSFQNCGISDFNLFLCGSDLITYAFVPTSDSMDYMVDTLHDDILIHFPIGYLTDFISIISTSTVGTLTVLNATVPNGIPGAGSHLTLDMTGVLDQFLNATTGAYINATASSTETLFEITNRYWKYILYILTIFYILRRIMGQTLIPQGMPEEGFYLQKKGENDYEYEDRIRRDDFRRGG